MVLHGCACMLLLLLLSAVGCRLSAVGCLLAAACCCCCCCCCRPLLPLRTDRLTDRPTYSLNAAAAAAAAAPIAAIAAAAAAAACCYCLLPISANFFCGRWCCLCCWCCWCSLSADGTYYSYTAWVRSVGPRRWEPAHDVDHLRGATGGIWATWCLLDYSHHASHPTAPPQPTVPPHPTAPTLPPNDARH
jgi:hypothetical protein